MKYLVSCYVTCEIEATSKEDAIEKGWEKFNSIGISVDGEFSGEELDIEEDEG